MGVRISFGFAFALVSLMSGWVFKKFGESQVEKLIKKDYHYFKSREVSVESLDYWRGDFKIGILDTDLIWTFNRFTGECLGWSSRAERIKKEAMKPPF